MFENIYDTFQYNKLITFYRRYRHVLLTIGVFYRATFKSQFIFKFLVKRRTRFIGFTTVFILILLSIDTFSDSRLFPKVKFSHYIRKYNT